MNKRPVGVVRVMFISRNVGMGVKREMYESVVVQMVTYGAKTFCMSLDERQKVDVMESRC